MGCGGSKEARRDDGRPAVTIGPPVNVNVHIPRNRIDHYGNVTRPTTIDMPSATIANALNIMSEYLAQRGLHFTACAVGGAVNCLLLRTRNATHDVDIFGSHLDAQSRMILDEAMHYAIRMSTDPLGTDWFNTETTMWMGGDLERRLTEETIAQNEVVWQGRGLLVLAAPWHYAFSAKVNRLLTGTAREYDQADAVTYLHRLITRNGGQSVTTRQIRAWAAAYHHETNDNILLTRINREYRQRYGRDAVIR